VWIGVQPQGKGNKPSLAIYEFDEKWNVVQYQMHHIDGLNYAHDFLLLPDYYVFHMTPFAKMSLKGALLVYSGISSPGQLMQHYPDLPSRFVIIPRHANAAHQSVKIVDTDPFHVSAQRCCVKY
jgi:all-trans-8'-apo-beta-carotenal 15,15'-oxygenase